MELWQAADKTVYSSSTSFCQILGYLAKRREDAHHSACSHEYVLRVSNDWRTDTIAKLRSLILKAEPNIVEEVKWRKASNPDGVPTFSCDGLVCTVETYKDKVKLTFASGASLDDSSGLFNASLDAGKRRAIDLFESDVLDERAFVELVQEAVAHNRS
jgi:hypothetical protein